MAARKSLWHENSYSSVGACVPQRYGVQLIGGGMLREGVLSDCILGSIIIRCLPMYVIFKFDILLSKSINYAL